jgi:glucose/arabinose dehydrogenase
LNISSNNLPMKKPGFFPRLTFLLSICFASGVPQAGTGSTAAEWQAGLLDPPDQPFRVAPMADSSRSIIVPLGTELHLAFDPHWLRAHSAWQGEGARLFGPPFHREKTPFLAKAAGEILWNMPPIFPWKTAPEFQPAESETGLPARNNFKADRARFLGVQLENGRAGFHYELKLNGERVSVRETPLGLNTGRGIARRFNVSPSEAPLWFLAQAELGAIAGRNQRAVIIERAADFMVIASENGAEVEWESQEKHLAYQEVLNVENALNSGFQTNLVGGKHALAWIKLPPSAKTREFAVFTFQVDELATALGLVEQLEQPAFSWREMVAERPRSTPLAAKADLDAVRSPSGDAHYLIEHFPLPEEIELLVGGMDWLPNGDLAVCTWPGEIYIVENAQGPVDQARYRRFARGLNEPLGLAVIDGEIYVAQKGELTRVRDTTGDGEADHFETISNQWGYSGNYHAYTFGPLLDQERNFHLFLTGQRGLRELPFQGWSIRVNANGQSQPFASGLRAPNGFAVFGPAQDIFVTDNQGNWVGACKLNHLQQGRFYGFPSSDPADAAQWGAPEDFQPPAVWFPRRFSPSTSDIAVIDDARFGPFKGQMLVGDFQNSLVMRVMLEKVQGEWQGAVWPFTRGFLGAVNRLSMGPDGRLYVGGCKRTWATPSPREFSLERVSFTGKTPFEVEKVRALPDGFELTFTEPAQKESAADPENYFISQFNYSYWQEYGSPELDHEGRPNRATMIEVKQVELSQDRRKVILRVDNWKTGFVTRVQMAEISNEQGTALRHETFYYTLNALPVER